MSKKDLSIERSKRFHDTVDFKKTDRVPNLGCLVGWKILDAGYTFPDAFYDMDIMEKCIRHIAENYAVDCISDPGMGNNYPVLRAFGDRSYYSLTRDCINVEDYALAEFDQIDRYLNDRDQFMWDTILPNKFKDLSSKTIDDFQKAYDAMISVQSYCKRIKSVLIDEYGIPLLSGSKWGAPIPFIESLITPVRNGYNLSVDLRRHPDELFDILTAVDEKNLGGVIKCIKEGPAEHDYGCCFDIRTAVRSSCYLNAKQFDRFYWDSMKKVYDAAAKKGLHMLILLEGVGKKLFDHLVDIPKGAVAVTVEDDLPKTRKKLPNITLVGGMPLVMLGYDTKDHCIDYAKRLIDTAGADGGYVFSESKFMCFRNDASSENFKAVCDFVTTYIR